MMKEWLPEELETVCCDNCKSTGRSSEYVRADGMRVVECARCGLAYLNPRPKSEFISKFYGEDYFTGAAAERGEGGLRCDVHCIDHRLTDDKLKLPRSIEIIKARYGGFQNKDVLEIGCATGDLLLEIKKAGALAQGVELSEFAADIARKRNLNVAAGTIDDIVATHRQFDIVMAFEVIEHVLSPTRFLSNIAQVMRPGGILVVSTPNYLCAKRFGNEWFGFNASYEHIYFYSLNVLKDLAQDAGFTMHYWETSTFMGGPDYSSRPFRLQVERVRNLLYFIKELGIFGTVRAVIKRRSGYYPYGTGHTLMAVFKKIGARNQ